MQLRMNGNKILFEKNITINEIKEIEDALSYNCASSVGFAQSRLAQIINFFKNVHCVLEVKDDKGINSFNNLQSLKNWLKEEKFDYTYYELRNTNLDEIIKHYR